MKPVECGDCKDFEKPIMKKHNCLSPGKCKSYEETLKTENQELIDKAFKERGTANFLYCTKRFCQKYKPIENRIYE